MKYFMLRSFDHAGYYETRVILMLIAIGVAIWFQKKRGDPRYFVMFINGVICQAGLELFLQFFGLRGPNYALSVYGVPLTGWMANLFQGCAEGGILALMSFWFLDLRTAAPDRQSRNGYLAVCALIVALAFLVGYLAAGKPITSPRPMMTMIGFISLPATISIAIGLMIWKKALRYLGIYYLGCLIYVTLTFTPLQIMGARYIGTKDVTGQFVAATLLAQIIMMTYSHLWEVAAGKIHYFAIPYALGQLNIGKQAARAARVAMVLLVVSASAMAQRVELLWPKGAPGALGTEDRDKPSLTMFLPAADKASGAAVVICPGGGYGSLAFEKEGTLIAAWLNERGVAGFVVKYRLGPRYHHPAPLDDVQQALRYVREHADEFRIKPDRVGIWGFSAGGHLASTAGTHFTAGTRPDLLILSYPVITFEPPYGHQGSRRNLLGETPDPKLVRSLSNETQVTAETPPTFLFHTTGDKGVPAENSVMFYLALRKAGVPAEMHVYEPGNHGVGLAPADRVLGTWPGRLEDWLRLRGFVK